MADLTDLREGRWGVSRIIEEALGSFTTAAMVQGLGVCHAHYPPLNQAKTGYTLPFAIVHFPDGVSATPDADTRLVPNRLLNTTLGELTTAQRNALRNNLEEWLTGYSYIDWDNTQQVKAAFSAAVYDLTTPLKRVLLDVFRHLGHTASRPRVALFESHNTEYLDDFSTDPATTGWVAVSGGAYTWDSANDEMDCDASVSRAAMYYPTDTGSIEHEAQATFFLDGRVSSDQVGGGVGRIHGTNDDFYFPVASNQGDSLILYKHVGGTRTTLATFTGYTAANDEFRTMRSAYSGAAGANVVIDIWQQNHSTSKPSDPGWIGVDGSPDETYTDSSADRLDDSTHLYCGIGWQGQGVDYDTRHAYFKERAISDRSGGASDPEGSLINGKLINGGLLLHGVLIQ